MTNADTTIANHLIRWATTQPYKLALFSSPDMRLLWASAEWGLSRREEVLIPGVNWLDHVHPQDLDQALDWVNAGDGATVDLRAGHPQLATRDWVRVLLTKRRAGNLWIATGEFEIPDEPVEEELQIPCMSCWVTSP